MTIVLGGGVAGPTFTDYSGLKRALVEFLDARGQDSLAEFIGYAEDYLRVNLDVTQLETDRSFSGATHHIPNLIRVKMVAPLDGAPLQRVSIEDLQTSHQTGTRPSAYAEWGDKIIIGPTPADDQVFRVFYVEELGRLSEANQSNWLMKQAPSLYLYAALVHAEAYLRDPNWIARFWEYVNSTIAALNGRATQKRASGVLRPNLGAVV